MARVWLEFDPGFLASLFGLKSTGKARVLPTGKIQIEVDHLGYAEGSVLEGLVGEPARVLIPTGVRPVQPIPLP